MIRDTVNDYLAAPTQFLKVSAVAHYDAVINESIPQNLLCGIPWTRPDVLVRFRMINPCIRQAVVRVDDRESRSVQIFADLSD